MEEQRPQARAALAVDPQLAKMLRRLDNLRATRDTVAGLGEPTQVR